MKKLLTELLEQLKFDGKDYRTESFPSIQEAIEIELQKPDPETKAYAVETIDCSIKLFNADELEEAEQLFDSRGTSMFALFMRRPEI